MMPRTRTTATFVALVALALAAVSARTDELAAEVHGGYFSMSATQSANAVFGSPDGFTWGAGGRYSFDRGLYVAAGVRTFSKEGERVFVGGPAEPVFPLSFPLSVRITPVFATVGYRFRQGKLIVPYAGIGGSLTSFHEDSEVARLTYDESRRKAGFHVVAGAELGRGHLRFGAEAGWSSVPNTVGFGGVSEVYRENDIGGWSLVGKLVLAFGRAGTVEPSEAEPEIEVEPEPTPDVAPEPESEPGVAIEAR
jgi:hypothetical protein